MNTELFERATLGGLLLDWAHWPECETAGLVAESFDDAFCRRVFSACLTVHNDGEFPDLLTVGALLNGEGRELDSLVDSCVTPSQTPAYAREVVSAARNRKLVAVLTDTTRTLAGGGDASGLFSQIDELRQPLTTDDPFPRITFHDLQTFKPNLNDHIAGQGWLRRGAGTLLTGGTGLGKSVMVGQIAISVSAGVPFFGIQTHRPHKTVYVGAENDIETLQRDIIAIQRNHPEKPCPIQMQANLSFHHVYGLAGDSFTSWLESRIVATKPELLVIDPYQAFLSGNADMNNSGTFFEFIRPVDALIKRYGCALLLVTHTPKPRDRESWTARESVYMAGGHNAISNWCRASCELTECPEFDGRFRLRFGKNAERHGMTDEDGRVIRDLFVEHSGNVHEPYWRLSDSQSEPSNSEYRDKVSELATDSPSLSYREIADKLGCSVGTVAKYYPKDVK